MRSLLVPVGVLALLVPPAAARQEGPPPDLELASIAVSNGLHGGIIGYYPRKQLVVHYDRTLRVFQALRRREGPDGPEVWAAEVTAERFRALLDMTAEGLAGLPLEDPPQCMDVYGRRTQVRLLWGERLWANGCPEGCTSDRSTVMPSEDDRRRFDAVVARLEDAVDALPLRRGRREDMARVPFLNDMNAVRSYGRVMQHVLADPLRHRLDLENVEAWDDRVHFYWRGQAGGDHGYDVTFSVGREGELQRLSPSPFREEVVPVETGMTPEQVRELLGEPARREECPDGAVVLTYRRPTPGPRPDLLSRLRFEDGRLCAP